jgi:hypothetical protein
MNEEIEARIRAAYAEGPAAVSTLFLREVLAISTTQTRMVDMIRDLARRVDALERRSA